MNNIKKDKAILVNKKIAEINKRLGFKQLPSKLSSVENELFSAHLYIERLLEKRILIHFLQTLNLPINSKNLEILETDFRQVFIFLSFYQKCRIVKDFPDFKDIIKKIELLNKHRNFFSHRNRADIVDMFLNKKNSGLEIENLKNLIISTRIEVAICLDIFTPTIEAAERVEDDVPF